MENVNNNKDKHSDNKVNRKSTTTNAGDEKSINYS